MKTIAGLIGAHILSVSVVFGGSEQIIKQRAKDLRDQNNARQGVPPPARPGQAAAPTPAPAPALTPQQQSLVRFRTDLDAIRAGSQVTAEQKQRLAVNLVGMAQGPGKPSLRTARLFVDDLAAGLTAKPLSAKSRERLLQNLQAAVSPGAMKQAQLGAIADDVQAAFVSAGVDRKDAMKIADGVKAMTAEAGKPVK
jgi:hypothetical protein